MADLNKCNRVVAQGRNGSWGYYIHVARTLKGSGTRSYNCISTDLQVSEWLGGCCYEHVYLVDRRAAQIKFQRFGSPAECVKAARRSQPKGNEQLYCARSNQVIEPALAARR